MLVAFLVAFPFIYALSPFTWYWADGRYALYLAPMLALGVVSAAEVAARVVGRTSCVRAVSSAVSVSRRLSLRDWRSRWARRHN